MIITVTPNPLLDFVISSKEPPAQGGHRRSRIEYTVGGKGINVARMLKSLGRPALAMTFAGGPNGEKIREKLKDQGISTILVPVEKETRLGINFVVEHPSTQTWWIEHGEELSEREVWTFLEKLKIEAADADYLVLSGTIPGNTHQNFYARVLTETAAFSHETFLDARNDALLYAMKAGGFFLKHNLKECQSTFNLNPFIAQQREKWVTLLRESGVWGSLVTDGANKAILWDQPKCFEFTPPQVREISAVGSGDATLAGLIFARNQGESMIEAVKWGMAAGAADALCAAPCDADYDQIKQLLSKVPEPILLP